MDMDKVAGGDQVNPYMTDRSLTTTLQRGDRHEPAMRPIPRQEAPFSNPSYEQGNAMARYGKGAQKTVKRAIHKRKKGSLKSGNGGNRATSGKQAIAIGPSEARRKGAKVPHP
ncbi:MAG: DUF6496 domain-containing protein [Nitrospira sp.]|nr:DUF6496 domain-containing protein [Nitrospira sp.]